MEAGETASFYDGTTARRRPVALAFEPDALAILENAQTLARWSYDDIRRQETPGGLLRLRSLSGADLARLDVTDETQKREFVARCSKLDEHEHASRRAVGRIVFWSLAAAASLVVTAIYLVPPLADRVAPFVPLALEKRMGDAVDRQLRAIFSGKICVSAEGSGALDRLARQLSAAAELPMQAEFLVLSSPVANAVTLPGGRIYLFEGLLLRAGEPDEVAGVLAHELGHVAHRDNMRRLIEAGGTSFLLGLLFGDITGSGALILAGQSLIEGAYSREAETAADSFAADTMIRLGRSPRPLGAFLLRLTGGQKIPQLRLFLTHPFSEERLAALAARGGATTGAPLLDDRQWQALKSICKSQ